MPEALTQKAREEKEEQRVLKRLQERRLKKKGIEVVPAAPKTPKHTKSGSRLVNPSKLVNPPVVVAAPAHAHLYGCGGIRDSSPCSKVLGSKGGSTASIGEKNKQSKTTGTKTPPTFMPDPNKIYTTL